jgi:hypothetical protein
MSRFADSPDAETDDALSPEREEPNCETCGEPCRDAIWAAHGQYAFCSDTCRDEYYKALESL